MTAPSVNPPDSSTAAGLTRSKRRPKLLLLLPLGLVTIAAGSAIWYFLARPVNSALTVSGRIEGYETDIGAKTPGRVDRITVREGDAVKPGQLLAQINDDEVQAQLQGARARVTAAREQERQALLQLGVIDSQIRESQLNVLQSEQDQKGRVYQAEANVAALEAQLKQTQSQLNLAKLNRDRAAALVREGAFSTQQFDQAQTNYETALATVEAVQKQIDAARGGLALAASASYNPYIRGAQLSALYQQRQRANAQVQTARAEIKNAQATEQQIQAQIGYLTIVSPIAGIVTARSVEPGAVVTTGKTLLSLLNPNSVYLRGYVPEGDIGRIKVGQKARVYLDSSPKQAIPAHVAAIDPQASFTPENIYFKDDRVKQVFGIKLAIDNPGGYAKPGMPADAEIVLE